MMQADPLVFDHLLGLPGIVHGVFTRRGGVSPGPWKGLNIGLGCGDDPGNVRENRRTMLSTLGIDRAMFLSQVHGRNIHIIRKGQVNPDELWDPLTGESRAPVTADGMITDEPGLGLVIQVADCQAVILYDPVGRVIANVHSGWRGSVADILGQCADRMVSGFGCRPRDIWAGIAPSLGPCCAEFVNYPRELPKAFLPYKAPDSPLFDFWKISRDQLMAKGLLPDRIQDMGMCTMCRSDLFFSYRHNKFTGRFAAVIGLENA
jgi:YfiH family protein